MWLFYKTVTLVSLVRGGRKGGCGCCHLKETSETHSPNIEYGTQSDIGLNKPVIKGILGKGITRKFEYRLGSR